MSRAGPIRACRRLAAFAAVTGAEIVRARLERRDGVDDLDRALRSSGRLARAVVRALGIDVDVRGVPPRELAVVVSNHRSYVDVPVVAATAPGVLLAKEEVASWPLIGEAARIGATVFVRRDDAESRSRALDDLTRVLRRGHGVTVFPEGTTFAGPGVLSFRSGAFRLAAAHRVAIVPVAISYADPRIAWVGDDSFLGHFLSRFGADRIRVSAWFGPPIEGDDATALKIRAEQWITEHVALLDADAAAVSSPRADGDRARTRPTAVPPAVRIATPA